MKECNYGRFVIDYIEDNLPHGRRCDFEAHLQSCSSCAAEVLRLRKLYGMLSEDPIIVPEPNFWREIQERVRAEAGVTRPLLLPRRRFAWWKLVPVLVPVMVVLAIFIFHRPDQKTVAIPISLNNIIQDTNLDRLMLDRIVDDDLVKSMNQAEPYYETELDGVITDLNESESEELIKKISEQYAVKI
jgi:hypothetical protein